MLTQIEVGAKLKPSIVLVCLKCFRIETESHQMDAQNGWQCDEFLFLCRIMFTEAITETVTMKNKNKM